MHTEIKPKAPGQHAHTVERHHELLQQILHRVEDQLREEGIHVPFDVVLAECMFVKDAMLTVGEVTQFQAVFGRTPIMLQDFEPVSETALDDLAAGVAGLFRHHLRIREIALDQMIQQTSQSRLERVINSKTRVALEQLELKQGDLVDFWRKPATKDESGWRGLATVIEVGTPTVLRCHNGTVDVRVQDLRRSLVYLVLLTNSFRRGSALDDPYDTLISFADSLRGEFVRIGWIAPLRGDHRRQFQKALPRWMRAAAKPRHTTILNAVLSFAANGLDTGGCIVARIGQGLANIESAIGSIFTVTYWWKTGRPNTIIAYESSGIDRTNWQEVAGHKGWSNISIVHFLFVNDAEYKWIMRHEPDVLFPDAPDTPSGDRPRGPDGPDEEDGQSPHNKPSPGGPPGAGVEQETPVPDTPIGSRSASMRTPNKASSSGSPSSTRSRSGSRVPHRTVHTSPSTKRRGDQSSKTPTKKARPPPSPNQARGPSRPAATEDAETDSEPPGHREESDTESEDRRKPTLPIRQAPGWVPQ